LGNISVFIINFDFFLDTQILFNLNKKILRLQLYFHSSLEKLVMIL